jgi:hypothetical protein
MRCVITVALIYIYMKYDFSSANDLKLRMKKSRDIKKLTLQINFTRVEMAKSESLKRNVLGYISRY